MGRPLDIVSLKGIKIGDKMRKFEEEKRWGNAEMRKMQGGEEVRVCLRAKTKHASA